MSQEQSPAKIVNGKTSDMLKAYHGDAIGVTSNIFSKAITDYVRAYLKKYPSMHNEFSGWGMLPINAVFADQVVDQGAAFAYGCMGIWNTTGTGNETPAPRGHYRSFYYSNRPRATPYTFAADFESFRNAMKVVFDQRLVQDNVAPRNAQLVANLRVMYNMLNFSEYIARSMLFAPVMPLIKAYNQFPLVLAVANPNHQLFNTHSADIAATPINGYRWDWSFSNSGGNIYGGTTANYPAVYISADLYLEWKRYGTVQGRQCAAMTNRELIFIPIDSDHAPTTDAAAMTAYCHFFLGDQVCGYPTANITTAAAYENYINWSTTGHYDMQEIRGPVTSIVIVDVRNAHGRTNVVLRGMNNADVNVPFGNPVPPAVAADVCLGVRTANPFQHWPYSQSTSFLSAVGALEQLVNDPEIIFQAKLASINNTFRWPITGTDNDDDELTACNIPLGGVTSIVGAVNAQEAAGSMWFQQWGGLSSSTATANPDSRVSTQATFYSSYDFEHTLIWAAYATRADIPARSLTPISVTNGLVADLAIAETLMSAKQHMWSTLGLITCYDNLSPSAQENMGMINNAFENETLWMNLSHVLPLKTRGSPNQIVFGTVGNMTLATWGPQPVLGLNLFYHIGDAYPAPDCKYERDSNAVMLPNLVGRAFRVKREAISGVANLKKAIIAFPWLQSTAKWLAYAKKGAAIGQCYYTGSYVAAYRNAWSMTSVVVDHDLIRPVTPMVMLDSSPYEVWTTSPMMTTIGKSATGQLIPVELAKFDDVYDPMAGNLVDSSGYFQS